MQTLVHQELQQLTALTRTLVDTFALYNEQKSELHRTLLTLLDDTGTTFRDRGRADKESHTASLKAELTTALRGINPMTMEKPTVRRHEMQNAIAFRVLQSLELELRDSLQDAAQTLQRAEDLISQIVLAAMQKGLITNADIANATTQAAVDALWRSIASDAEIALAQKRVLLLVSVFDVTLLLDEVLARLRA
ncbi:MAG TPA: hypothetical protein VJZ00_08870 [Thermoanaerobaculia bacterium]|nr:hypothetical protein [Thermoanaerobaculia bacterium]